MAGDPYLAFPEFKSSYIECGKRAHASHVKGGIRAMGYLESEGAWRLRFPNTTNADGTVAPGVPYPEKAEMPDEPPAGHTQAIWQAFVYKQNKWVALNETLVAFEIELHEALGPERLREVKHPITGMADVSPAQVFETMEASYGVMTSAKLTELQNQLVHLGPRPLPGFVAFTNQVHKALEANGQPLSQLNKQNFFAQGLSYNVRFTGFVNRYHDKYPRMEDRSYAALSRYTLDLDASTPAPESANAAHGYHDGDGYAAAAHSKGNGGPRSDGYGGPRSNGHGGQRSDGYGGQRSDGYGGQRSDGHGGQRSDGYGGPRSDGYGGQRSDGNRAHSPRRTDDRIDTLEKALAKLIDTLATKDNPAPKDARHSTTHFSFLASY